MSTRIEGKRGRGNWRLQIDPDDIINTNLYSRNFPRKFEFCKEEDEKVDKSQSILSRSGRDPTLKKHPPPVLVS